VQEVREALETLFGLSLPETAELDPALARACAFPATIPAPSMPA
jgi:hypothetical protein